ncbi:MAG: hypothetical protein HY671_15380 [Chloroflexi bacterium]|nr:hypothetical protein [Chloroflexota bacterium]
MKLSKLFLVVITVVSLMVGAVSAYKAPVSAQAQTGAMTGLFGTLIAKGADSITVNTAAEGPQNVKIDAATAFRMPGREVVGKDDLQVGDRLAILARKSAGLILTATDVMLVPGQPQAHHVVGAVTAIQGANVTITQPNGNKVTIEMTGTLPKLGEVLTVVAEREVRSGKMRSRSLQRVEQVEDRLSGRVRELEREDARGRAAEIEKLKDLVEDNVAHRLSILRDSVELELGDDKGGLRQAFDDARRGEGERLRGLGRGSPKAEVMGRITAIDAAAGTVTIKPRLGEPMTLKVSAATRIHKDNNERAALADLKVDDSVLVVRFDPDSKEIVRIVAKTPRLESEAGIVSAVNAAQKTVSILTEKSKEPLLLTLDTSSQITRDGAAATLDKLAAGDVVESLQFKDGSLVVTRLSVLSPAKAGGKTVQFAGMIDSFTATQVVVSGQKITVNAQTKFKGKPQVGAAARVEAAVQSDGSLMAREINVSQRRGPSLRDELENVSFTGLIESASAAEIMVGGKKIAINAQTKLEGKPEAGVVARVEFTLQADGSLLAKEVKVGERRGRGRSRDELDALGNVVGLAGSIQSISDTEIMISGQKVMRSAQTEVKGTLQVGIVAKVEGSLQADGSILAREIKAPAVLKAGIRVAGNEIELVGAIESATPTQIMLFGKKVAIDAQTQVKGTLQAGALAKVEGSLQPDGSILAREVKSPPDAREELEARTRGVDPIGLRGTIQSVTGNEMVIAGKKVIRDAQTEVTGTPQAGATAKVEGGLQADGSILAREIKVPSDKLPEIQANGNLVELTGAIESLAANQIMALGQKVTTNAQTQVGGALLAGAIVKIEGSFQPDGSILAREVFVLPHILEIRGREAELRGRAAEGEIRGREPEARGREAEGEAPRGADSGGGRGGGSGSGGSGR